MRAPLILAAVVLCVMAGRPARAEMLPEAASSVVPTAPLGDPPGAEQLPRWQRHAEAGHVCAQAALGYLQAQGIGMPAAPGAGRDAIALAGARGCRRAHYLLVRLDETGPRAEQRDRARAALHAGAAAGDGHALNHLGTVHEIAGDAARARTFYRDAHAAGNRAAPQNLARLRRLAELRPDEREPLDALERRARAGDAEAQYRVARRIHRGEGASIDYVAAWRWYRESARQGFKPAHEMMTFVLAQPTAKDGKITARWFANLALVDAPSDPLLKQRGLRQPVVDEDLFYAMR